MKQYDINDQKQRALFAELDSIVNRLVDIALGRVKYSDSEPHMARNHYLLVRDEIQSLIAQYDE